jgi:hypothetical protein
MRKELKALLLETFHSLVMGPLHPSAEGLWMKDQSAK